MTTSNLSDAKTAFDVDAFLNRIRDRGGLPFAILSPSGRHMIGEGGFFAVSVDAPPLGLPVRKSTADVDEPEDGFVRRTIARALAPLPTAEGCKRCDASGRVPCECCVACNCIYCPGHEGADIDPDCDGCSGEGEACLHHDLNAPPVVQVGPSVVNANFWNEVLGGRSDAEVLVSFGPLPTSQVVLSGEGWTAVIMPIDVTLLPKAAQDASRVVLVAVPAEVTP